MASELDKLKAVLGELFQLDEAEDLDFGMYRVLRLRRQELKQFLGETLEAEVRAAMGALASGERGKIESRMREIEAQATRFGGRADADPEYVELRGRLEAAGDATARERQVYAHLSEFFSRYYEDGDFVSLPRLRRDANGRDTYAIPYDGSEVVLHWANKDQYYVKSGEFFARYAFAIDDGRRVVLRLVDAETDPDNVKSADAGKRRFRLVDGAHAVTEEGGELVLRFVYAPDEAKQPAVNEATEARVRELAPAAWRDGLFAESPKGSDPKPTVLGWHLRQYTERNKRDYFIHKDLGGFLRRELDHYLKTEVFDLDAVEDMSPEDTARAVALVRTIRKVARPIVTFLATMEDFQKRLFLKKKLVLRTDWCVTLDRVDERFYPRIAANRKQVQRWKELFAIDDIEASALLGGDAKGETVSVEFLKRNRGLVVETRLFDAAFTAELLASFSGLDEGVTGVMVRGDNAHALRLLVEAHGGVGAVLIDPPYNTGNDGFLYKDAYRHSTWLAMIEERLLLARRFMAAGSALVASIDDGERENLGTVLQSVFGSQKHSSSFVWQKRDTPANDSSGVSVTHDHLLLAPLDDRFQRGLFPRTEEQLAVYKNPDDDPRGVWTRTSLTVKNFVAGNDYEVVSPSGRKLRPPAGMGWAWSRERMDEAIADERIWWGVDGDGTPYRKKFLTEVEEGVVPTSWWAYDFAGSNRNARVQLRMMFGAESPFDTPKPELLFRRALQVVRGHLVLDFFAGSGTTGHAVLNLNREDEGNRKFILVEVNDYFDTVLLPRILKATYAKDWKDGKPVEPKPVPGGALYKVLYLESYEDTLANLELPPPPGENLLPFKGGLRREYVVRYLLDRETKGARLDLDRFRKPFGWTMEVRRGGLVEPDHPVDLVESFNYLIGLRVRRVGYFGSPDLARYVEGTVREGGDTRKVLVLWRDCDAVSDAALARFFQDREFAPISSREYDVIYVNGDPAPLENLRRDGETWKVRAIEDSFERLSFADDLDA